MPASNTSWHALKQAQVPHFSRPLREVGAFDLLHIQEGWFAGTASTEAAPSFRVLCESVGTMLIEMRFTPFSVWGWPRIQLVHGTVPQKCAGNALPARSGLLYRPAIEALRCRPLPTSSTRAPEVTPN